jgi:transposase
MFTENPFPKLLQLEDGWIVESVGTDFSEQEIYIQIASVLDNLVDDQTGDLCKVHDHGQMRSWRHLDTMQYKTFIKCQLPRIMTSACKVKTIQPNWASDYELHTLLFKHAVIDLLKASKNQTKTARLMRCRINIVNRIMHLSTERVMKRTSYSQVTFKHLSIDEKSFKKVQHYSTVLSHPSSGCVLDVGEDRTKESCKKLFEKSLTSEQLGKVRPISMDKWKAYMQTAQEILPNASIVYECFHLEKYLNDAINKVRRKEVKKHLELKNSRYTLFKNPESLSEKQRIHLESIEDANYEVSKAWQVRENFMDLFSSGKLFDWLLFNGWTADATRRKIKEIDKVVGIFNKHVSGVVKALLTNFTNAMVERLNGKILDLKTIGRGYRTFVNFRSTIISFKSGLDISPLT